MNCRNDPCLDDHFPVEVYYFFSWKNNHPVGTKKEEQFSGFILTLWYTNTAGLENDANIVKKYRPLSPHIYYPDIHVYITSYRSVV